MGQKVNPHGFRVGPTLFKGWDSVMYAEKNYKIQLNQDLKIRKLINQICAQALVSKIIIERSNRIVITIYVKKPGIVIGKSGSDIEKLKKEIRKIVPDEIFINIHEVKKPNINSSIIAQTIAGQLEKRVSFRKAMKMAMQAALKQGAQGIKINVSGRLGGAEIARDEWYKEGRVPLHTLRAKIEYATAEAHTTYGIICVTVWVYEGDHLEVKKNYN